MAIDWQHGDRVAVRCGPSGRGSEVTRLIIIPRRPSPHGTIDYIAHHTGLRKRERERDGERQRQRQRDHRQ